MPAAAIDHDAVTDHIALVHDLAKTGERNPPVP